MSILRILHLEDDPLDAELVLNTLTDAGMNCEIRRVDSEGGFTDAIREDKFDLIISDFSMPGFNGKAALKMARQKCPEVPFIFVSGTIGEDAAIESLLGGATDYVLKHRFSRLIPAVQRAQRESQQRAQSEEALRNSEARYRQVFERNPYPMWVYELDTKAFLAVNDAAVERYGYSRDEFLRMSLADVETAIQAPSQAPYSTWAGKHRLKNGALIDVEAASNEVPFGGKAACLVSIHDVTEKKKIESQLLRTQRMESIGTLAGGIAHDLNNVLAPILMAVQLLRERMKDPRTAQLLETMETSAKRGASIVRQVLTFARGAEGEHIAIQPKHLLGSMEKMLGETFPKSIRIETHFPNNLWIVVGDPTQIDQVLLNLCVNARDAMPKGGVLRITASNTILDEHYTRLNPGAKAGPHVLIDVSDAGEGIPPDIIDKIFEPFFTTKEIGKGTGLGLSTVIAIVKAHGGFVNVYSEPGRGTSFKVFIPAKESAETREAGEQLAELPHGNGEKILVIDDETAVREIAQLTLETYNYQVFAARNGAEALAVYAEKRNEIQLVLLDMMMPIMDGPATAHALKTMNPNVRIVAASGLLDTAKQEIIASQMGDVVCAVLAKPYTAEKLLATVHDVIHRSAI